MPKYIRELRMGRPMSYKTGAVVGTYPRPMLVLSGDPHGLTIIPSVPAISTSPFKMEVTSKDIGFVTPDTIDAQCQLDPKGLPPITVFQFSQGGNPTLDDLYQPNPNTAGFRDFNKIGNAILKKCPWKTVVIDPITELQNTIFGHLASVNPTSLSNAMKWAPSIGMKVCALLSSFHRLNAHFVAIFHSGSPDKDEDTSKINISPILYSAKARDTVGGLFAQVLAAEIEGGKPIVLTTTQGFYTGIGCKWPHNLPPKCGAHFQDIYGTAVKNGEIEI